MQFDSRYKKLNKNQRLAVDTIDGPLLVIAGPGSGKTEILAMRVAKILKETDTAPNSILCLTFTESASLNMRERLLTLIGKDAYKVLIYTFHSFCTDIISSYPEYFFDGASFKPADDVTVRKVLEDLFSIMDFKNPLRSYHTDQGFVFLEDCRSAISDIKKAGLNPDEFSKVVENNRDIILKINPLIKKYIPARISKKDISLFGDLYSNLLKIDFEKSPIKHINPLSEFVMNSLNSAISDSKESDSSKPLTLWKDKFVTKNDDGDYILKDYKNLDKMVSLANLYNDYTDALYKLGFFDFEDMILKVIEKLENNDVFLSIISEKYQYILVDEFQDTNDAQMRLLWGLTSSPVNEGRPNLMAVGDDDQAIYKFQGAEVLNMLNFTKKFKDTKIVSLNENYRSTKDILDISESIISQSNFSLRKAFPEVEKKIISSNSNLKNGNVIFKKSPDVLSEYYFIAKEIENLKNQGVKYSDIAVISRKHNSLKELVYYLHNLNIPVSYEKKKNVLDDPIIKQIILMLRFVDFALKGEMSKDELLPEILAFPFWQIDEVSVWKISLLANKQKISWLEAMKASSDKRIENIADFLIEVSVKAKFEPAERIIDMLVGSKISSSDEVLNEKFTSPLKDFYFSFEKLSSQKALYLSFLSSLRVFIEAIREYSLQTPMVSDILSFVDVYLKNNLQITDNSFYTEGDDSVNLLTAHKSKGLEFPIVFVMSATEEVWISKQKNSKITFPKNLPIKPQDDDIDDKIRLFYVALTRAKHTLYVTSYEKSSKGQKVLIPEFLGIHQEKFEDYVVSDKLPIIDNNNREIFLSNSHKELLKPILTDYRMSVTHLNNFLNVITSGPKFFLEQNLLHFPQAKNVSSVYGTAIHESIDFIYSFLKREGVVPDIDFVFKKAESIIFLGRLSKTDSDFLLGKTKYVLGLYLEKNKDNFKETDLIETDFRKEGVSISNALITGKIDKIVLDGSFAYVYDFKTGKPFESFDDKDEYGKLLAYKRQLIFYKLLIENSTTFSKYKVDKGFLEFMEPKNDHFDILEFDIEEKEVSRLKSLIEIVYQKIIDLDFPDINKYPQTVNGIKQFEDDLLSGSI